MNKQNKIAIIYFLPLKMQFFLYSVLLYVQGKLHLKVAKPLKEMVETQQCYLELLIKKQKRKIEKEARKKKREKGNYKKKLRFGFE